MNTPLIIYTPDHQQRATINIGRGSTRVRKLDGDDKVVIKDTVSTRLNLHVGDYILTDEGMFVLTELQQPTHESKTFGLSYELTFEAPYKLWKNRIFKLGNELAWGFTGTLSEHMEVFLNNLEALHEAEGSVLHPIYYFDPNTEYKVVIGSEVKNEPKHIDYQSVSLLDALTKMAGEWKTEVWVEGDYIYFGRCEVGNAVDFEIGVNVTQMKPSSSKDEYATRIFAYGGTKNITDKYRKSLIFDITAIAGGAFWDADRPIYSKYLKNDAATVLSRVAWSTLQARCQSDSYSEDWSSVTRETDASSGAQYSKLLFKTDNNVKVICGGSAELPEVGKYEIHIKAKLRTRRKDWLGGGILKCYASITPVGGTQQLVEFYTEGHNGNWNIDEGIDITFSGSYHYSNIIPSVIPNGEVWGGKNMEWELQIFDDGGSSVIGLNHTGTPISESELPAAQADTTPGAPAVWELDVQDVSIQPAQIYPEVDVECSFPESQATKSATVKADPNDRDDLGNWRYKFFFSGSLPSGVVVGDQFTVSGDGFYAPLMPASYYTPDDDAEEVLKSLTERRLLMPKDTPYIDVYEDMSPTEVVETVVTNDEIFPEMECFVEVCDPPTYEKKVIDKDDAGNSEVRIVTYYLIKAKYEKNGQYYDFPFSSKYIIEGTEKLQIRFTSGALNGLTFDVSYNDDESRFEIIPQEYGITLPSQDMKPEDDDTFVILGWDTAFFSDTEMPMTEQAEERLKQYAQECAEKIVADTTVYDCTVDAGVAEAMYHNTQNNPKTYPLGQKVTLINEAYFTNEQHKRESRIIGFEYPLDYPYDNSVYTVGESSKYSLLGAMESEIKGMAISRSAAGVSGGGASGSATPLVTTTNNLTPSDSNAYSALKSDERFLHKDGDDAALGHIDFNNGISVNGGAAINGGLNVSGRSNLGGDVDIAGDDNVNGRMNVDGKATMNDDMSVYGHTELGKGLSEDDPNAVRVRGAMRSNNFIKGSSGWKMDGSGNGEVESLTIRSFLEVFMLLINRQQAQEGDTIFTDNDQVEGVEHVSGDSYILTLKEKWDGYITAQMYGNILKGRINTLAANEAGVSDVDVADCVEQDGANKYYTTWMLVTDTHNTDMYDETLNPTGLKVNQVRVTLYSDLEIPAGRNFPPCVQMVVVRMGHIDWVSGDQTKYSDEGYTSESTAKAAVMKRQQVFMLSTTEGRIMKLNGVKSPTITSGNYGVTIGEVPDFIHDYAPVEVRLVEGRDYLFAQGVIVSDFIKCNASGTPLTNYFDKGNWSQSATYLADSWSDTNLQYQTDEVWHNGSKWRCKLTHTTAKEPGTTAGADYWSEVLTSGTSVYVSTTEVAYATTAQYANPSSLPANVWSTTYPSEQTLDAKPWLHTRTTVNYSDGKSTVTYQTSRVGIDGDGITGTDVYYYATMLDNIDPSSPSIAWEDEFSDLTTPLPEGTWLWIKTVYTYSTGEEVTSYSVSRVGVNGVSYLNTEEYYAISSSNNTPPAGCPNTNQDGTPLSLTAAQWAAAQQQQSFSNWSHNKPSSITNNNTPYLWNFEVTMYSDQHVLCTVPICVGNFARGVKTILELYGISANGEKTAHGLPAGSVYLNDGTTQGWTDELNSIAPTATLPYLWNKTVTVYNDSVAVAADDPNRETLDPDHDGWKDDTCDVMYHVCGVKGNDGDSITKQSETYRYAVTDANADHPAADSTDWKTTKAAAITAYNTAHSISGSDLAQNAVMWTKTDITWSDGSHTILYSGERNPNDGLPGQDIVTGTTVVTYCVKEYAAGQSPTQPNDNEFGPYNASAVVSGKWLWSKSTTPYYKANDLTTPIGYSSNYNVSYIGTNGTNGRAFTASSEHYKASVNSSGETAPTSDAQEWTTDPNVPDQQGVSQWGPNAKFLWSYERNTYTESDGTQTIERTTPRVIAIFTEDGNPGKGIDSITNYYAISSKSSGVTKDSGLNQDESWTTTVQVPTASKPYLWNYEKITWSNYGSGDQYTYTDARVIGYFGKDGESPWHASLNNEMDSVACDSNGSPTAIQTVETKVLLYQGSTSRTPTITKVKRNYGIASSDEWTTTDSTTTPPTNGVRVRWSNGTVYVDYHTGAVITRKDTIEITFGYSSAFSQTLTFTVNGIKGDARYNLIPSATAISKSAAGVHSPSTISCSYNKFDVNKGSYVTASGGTIKYTKDGGTTETTYSSPLTPGTDFTANVTFILYVGSTLADRQTIHIVSDGEKGDPAVSYIIDTTIDNVVIAANSQSATVSFNISFFKQAGSESKEAYAVYYECVKRAAGGQRTTLGLSITTKVSTATITNATVGPTDTIEIFTWSDTVDTTYATYLVKKEIPILKSGDTGAKGDMGRTPYYAGHWNDSTDPDYIQNSTTLRATDYETPYVKFVSGGVLYMYMWVGENFTKTKSQMSSDAPGGGSGNWVIMVTDFMYLITKAVFSEYAKLGSAIFNKDFMFSQYGLSGGAQDDNYEDFSPDFPNGDKQTVFSQIVPIGQTSGTQIATVYLIAGETYTVAVTASKGSATGTLSVGIAYTGGSSTLALTFSTTRSTQEANFTASVTGIHTIYVAYTGSGTCSFGPVTMKSNTGFVPNILQNWFTGYAHFGGDSTRFNPDGSGKLANGRINWNSDGDISLRNALIGGFIFNEPNEDLPYEVVFNPFGRSEYMNAYMGGSALPAKPTSHVLKFPDCGSNISLLDGEPYWDSYDDAELVLPFYYPTEYCGANVTPYGDPPSSSVSTTSSSLQSLLTAPLETAIKYLGSTMTIRHKGSGVGELALHGVKGYGILSVRSSANGYDYSIKEYDPWGYRTVNWTLTDVGTQYLTRRQVIDIIEQNRVKFVSGSYQLVWHSSTAWYFNNGATSGNINCTVDDTHGVPSGTPYNDIPCKVANGYFVMLKCESDERRIFWSIVDFFAP